jgi:hypothetical protein
MSPCFEARGFILRETVVYAVWYVLFYMHRCEQSGGQESPTAYTCMIKEGAWVRFGLYLRGGGFESSAGPSDVGFRVFSYAEANLEPVSGSRLRSFPFISVTIRHSRLILP